MTLEYPVARKALTLTWTSFAIGATAGAITTFCTARVRK